MRSLFSRVSSAVFEGTTSNPPSSSSSSASSVRQDLSTTSIYNAPRSIPRSSVLISEINPDIILVAAQSLSDAMQEILCDTEGLSGENVSGFERLLIILETEAFELEISLISQSRGIGCLQILLNNISHSKFVEICNQTALATNLMNALRLLRMYEIKLAKNVGIPTARLDIKKFQSTESGSDDPGITFSASQRLCTVFGVLCSDSQTVEKLRQSLVKLLTFPLSSLPRKAIHLQEHSSTVLKRIFTSGLTYQLVFFLHDVQAIKHMCNSLNDLMTIETEQKIELRGLAAEKVGMWFTGVDALVTLITSTVSISMALMEDFEKAGGYKLMVHFLQNSTPETLIQSMNVVTRLFFNPNKNRALDEPISCPSIGAIFVELLVSTLGLRRCVTVDDGIEKLVSMSQHLADNSIHLVARKEHIIQNIAYSLLTLYSNDPRDCNLLEETYHFLPTLIVSLPTLKGSHTISAVLTTLNYVCQCVESAATIPVISLCAASSIIASCALKYYQNEELSSTFLMQLDLASSSFDAIIRSHSKFAMIVVRCGMLKYLLCGPLEQLLSSSLQGISIPQVVVPIYVKLLDFLITLQRKGQFVADISNEVYNSNLQNIIRDLIVVEVTSQSFVANLLVVLEEIAKAGTFYLEDVMKILIDILHRLSGRYEKICCVLDCLSRIIQASDEASQVWRRLDGFDVIFTVIQTMERVFHNVDLLDGGKSTLALSCFECITSTLNFIAFEMTLSSFSRSDEDYDSLCRQSRKFNLRLANALRFSSIFSSPFAEKCLLLVFELVNGMAGEDATIVNPLAIEIIFDLLPHLEFAYAVKAIQLINHYVDKSHHGAQMLSDSGIIRQIIIRFHPLFVNETHPLGGPLLSLLRSLMSRYLTLDDLNAYLYYIVRTDILVEDNSFKRLLPPWQAYDDSLKCTQRSWDSLEFLVDLATKHSAICRIAPHVVLGSQVSTKHDSPAHLSILMSESSKSFPNSAFTFSVWVKVGEISNSFIPIISISSNSLGGYFFEAHLETQGSFLRIYIKKGSTISTMRFKHPTSICTTEWNSIVIAFRQQKKSVTKPNLFVFFNGIKAVPINADVVDLILPSSGQSVDINIGNAVMNLGTSISEEDKIRTIPNWNVGPLLLFDECLSQTQISYIFLKGYSYSGSFSAQSPLTDYLATTSCDLLSRCNTLKQPADVYIESLGLKGLEVVVEPLIEQAIFSTTAFDVPTFPNPILAYNSYNSVSAVLNHSSEVGFLQNNQHTLSTKRITKTSLLNSSPSDTGEKLPVASLLNTWTVSNVQSIATCVASLGGPEILMPLLQSASTERGICQFFLLLNACVRENTANLKYMQSNGYKICGFLLSVKPKKIITLVVIRAIFDLCVSKCSKDSNSAESYSLLVDTSAFFHLILNHQIWDARRCEYAREIVKFILSLCTDVRYGNLNAKRLSVLGVSRWVLTLTVFGANLCSKKTFRNLELDSDWTFVCSKAREVAESSHDEDHFLRMVMSVVQEVMLVDIRKRDLEYVASLIMFYYSSTKASRGGNSKSSPSVENKAGEFENDDANLLPLDMTRIYLMRFLCKLYEESSGGLIFRNTFSPEWCLSVLEKTNDIAMKQCFLRFLGLMIQRDIVFQRDFSAKDGFKALDLILTSSVQRLPVILPLLSMLFRIPMSMMPHTSEIRESKKVVQLLDIEECSGPDVTEPTLSEFTLPVLGVVFECLASSAKHRGTDPASILQNDIIIGLFEHAYECKASFRQLMQHRVALEMLSNTTLYCSNAVDEFGCHIFTSAIDSMNLSASLQENYIPEEEGTIDRLSSPDLNVSSPKSLAKSSKSSPRKKGGLADDADSLPIERNEVVLCGIEGVRISEFISSSIFYAISEYRNPAILCNFLLYFPQNLAGSFVYGFQRLIFDRCLVVIDRLVFSTTVDAQTVKLIANMFSHLVPLARARVLDDVVQVEIMKFTIDFYVKLSSMNAKSLSLSQEKFQQLLKDLGTTARFFTVACLHTVHDEKRIKAPLRLAFLENIRCHMHQLLAPKIMEDLSETIRSKKDALDDKGSGVAVLETFQISWGSDMAGAAKKTNDPAVLAMALADKLRVSQAFCMAMICSCYSLILDDDSAIRLEAARIFSLLLIHRPSLIEQLLGNNSTSVNGNGSSASSLPFGNVRRVSAENTSQDDSKDIDFHRDGLCKLIPSSPSFTASYELFLRTAPTASNDSEGEEGRVAEFSFWFSDNSSRFKRNLLQLESILSSITPLPAEVSETIRQLQSFRAKEEKNQSANRVLTAISRAEEGQKLGHQVALQLQRWNVFGVVYVANGGSYWKKVWNVLQAGPLWGYFAFPASLSISSLNQPCLMDSSTEEIDSILMEAISSKSWKLDNTEGAERARKRLEQDFSVPIAFFRDASRSRTESASVMEKSELKVSLKSNEEAISLKNDMEGFLKEIAKKGLNITRMNTSASVSGSLDDGDETPDAEDLLLTTDGSEMTSDAMGTLPSSDERVSSTDALPSFEDVDEISSGLIRSQSPTQGLMPQLTSAEFGSTGSNLKGVNSLIDFEGIKKSQILSEIVKGMIGTVEWAKGKLFNVQRIYGLEAQPGLLILTATNLHVLGGFRLKSSSSNTRTGSSRDNILVWTPLVAESDDAKSSSTPVNNEASPAGITEDDNDEFSNMNWLKSVWRDLLGSDFAYHRMPLDDVYSIFKRRYQLKNSAMEITDTSGFSLLFSCETVPECDDVLLNLIEAELPASIFYRVIGMKNLELLRGLSNMYNRLMAMLVSRITKMWQHGELSNFEYLMHLNAAAGRSFQDLTQYPVFPWILADYSSEELDLNDPKSFRDLSKPMGAIGARRANQYKERYRTMDEFKREGIDGTPPPFYYGTHYSCAGYVLHFLLRLQPFSNMAVALQGGHFDKPDRLFLSIENSWKSASQDNLQDVRELTPEFFYLPEFLKNSNDFDLGSTQKGERVNDVNLPAWAHGDPKEFIRIHREALESRYVSENLHSWIDLIFGYKQRGPASEEAMNVFIHLTYDGEVDVDAITDPVLRDATIAQINNFGQTPTKLFNKPHPKKIVPDIVKRVNDTLVADSSAIQWHEHVSPPLCVVGAPEYVLLNKVCHSQVTYIGGMKEGPVGDMRLLSRDRLIAVPEGSTLVGPAFKKIIRLGNSVGSLSFHSSQATQRHAEAEKDISYHENLHTRRITCISVSKSGDLMATGSEDGSMKLWNIRKQQISRKIEHLGTYCGHTGKILCLDMSPEYEIIVSGSADHTACVWDIRTSKLLRILGKHLGPVISISISTISGYITTVTATQLRLYSINGVLLSSVMMESTLAVNGDEVPITHARVALAPPCAEWQDGVVAVTGHENGFVYLWKLKRESIEDEETNVVSVSRKLVPNILMKTHRAHITSLRLCPTVLSKSKEIVERSFDDAGSLDLLVGDADGFVSRWSAFRLDLLELSQSEMQNVLEKCQRGESSREHSLGTLESLSLPSLLKRLNSSSVGTGGITI